LTWNELILSRFASEIPLDGAARAINAITYPGRGNSSWRIHRNSCDWAGSMDLWRSVRCPSNCTGCIHLQIERVERSVSIESCLIRLDQVFRNRCVGIMTSYWIRAKSAYLPQCMHMCLIISFYVCIYLHASLQWRALYSDGNCLDFPQSILTNMPMTSESANLYVFDKKSQFTLAINRKLASKLYLAYQVAVNIKYLPSVYMKVRMYEIMFQL